MTTQIAQISPIIMPLATARAVIAGAVAKATQLGTPHTITVVDGAGLLVEATRMDGAAIASIDTSLAKARTSVLFGAATADLAGAVRNGGPLASIETATSSQLAFVAGAVPITDAAGVVIGAIGAGGGTPDQDHDVALAGITAI
jgi:uncharacterized protein GlcG (DUF336 family)